MSDFAAGVHVRFTSPQHCLRMAAGRWEESHLVATGEKYRVVRTDHDELESTLILHDIATPRGFDGNYVYLPLRKATRLLQVVNGETQP